MRASNINKLINYANEKLVNINFNEGCYDVDFILNGNCSYLANLISEVDDGRKLWGQGNPEPMIAIENITLDKSNIQIIGSNKDTLKFTYNNITYIKFKATNIIDKLNEYGSKLNINIVGKSNMNYWGGRATPQIIIEAIEIKNNSVMDF